MVYLHDPENNIEQAVEQGAPALERMKAEGLCQAIGVGSNDNTAIRAILAACDLDVAMVAGSITLLDHSALTEVIPLCQQNDVKVVAAGVFNSGVLASTEPSNAMYAYAAASPVIVDRVKALGETCKEFGVSLRAAAMAFPGRFADSAAVCVGARSPEEAKSNAADWGVDLPQALWDELEARNLISVDSSSHHKTIEINN